MSMMDGEDFKKKVDQVAAIKLRAEGPTGDARGWFYG